MRNYHGPVGQTMTYVMGAIGAPGIPGAHTLAQYDRLVFSGGSRRRASTRRASTGRGSWTSRASTLRVRTASSTSDAAALGQHLELRTRWDLINDDTLPAYQHLLADDRQQVIDILNTPVQDRIDDARIVNNIDDILGRWSDWDVSVQIGVN